MSIAGQLNKVREQMSIYWEDIYSPNVQNFGLKKVQETIKDEVIDKILRTMDEGILDEICMANRMAFTRKGMKDL